MNYRIATPLVLLSVLSACGAPPQGVGFGNSIGSATNPSQTQAASQVPASRNVQSGELSREALFACTRQAGITGGFSTTFTLANGVQRRVVKSGGNVTEAQAAEANECLGNA